MEYKNIILEKKDGITRLIVNRPAGKCHQYGDAPGNK